MHCHMGIILSRVWRLYKTGFGLSTGFIGSQYSTQLQCKHFTTNSQLSLSDVLSGWQPLLWHHLKSLALHPSSVPG
jgi:hypothetical protein